MPNLPPSSGLSITKPALTKAELVEAYNHLAERHETALHELEDIKGNVYLWRLGEIDAEKAVTAIRDVLEPTCV